MILARKSARAMKCLESSKRGLLILTFDVNFGEEQRSFTLNEFVQLCNILR